MKIRIYPSKCNGQIVVPPSKSMAHRAIICASLANGTSIIDNIAYSDDIIATINGMKTLGANIVQEKERLIIEGIKDFNNLRDREIDCNESGSTLRFFIPIFSLTEKKIIFKGRNRLLKRPQKIYEEMFNEQGLYYFQDSEKIEIQGSLKAKEYIIRGDISSQFISGLLFILPILKSDSSIKILPPFESRSYIELTISLLKTFGVEVKFLDDFTIFIKGNQKYIPNNYTVEGDYSQFAFFAILGALNNTLECNGLNLNSKQGDKKIVDILKKCGITIEEKSNGYLIKNGIPSKAEINLEDCPDLGPILTVLGSFSKEKFHIFNAQRLRYKESDRIEAMEKELKKIGVNIYSDEANIYIEGRENTLISDEVYGQKDHRIVMSLSIAATLLNKPLIIDGAEAINKSYPNFFEDLKKLGIELEYL